MDEKARWDALVREHHCLPWRRLFGKALHHVAIHGDRWLALIGWQVGARDRWTGWTAEQQFSRLRLVANNARHVLLGRDRPRNLASRVLALSLRRLPSDMTGCMVARCAWPRPSSTSPVLPAPAAGHQAGGHRA